MIFNSVRAINVLNMFRNLIENTTDANEIINEKLTDILPPEKVGLYEHRNIFDKKGKFVFIRSKIAVFLSVYFFFPQICCSIFQNI